MKDQFIFWLVIGLSGAVYLAEIEDPPVIEIIEHPQPPPPPQEKKKREALKTPALSPAKQKLLETLKEGQKTLEEVEVLIDEVWTKK